MNLLYSILGFVIQCSYFAIIALVFVVTYQVAQEHDMVPRDSAFICGYSNYQRLLELSLASLK
jgi:hypothetical protein